MKAYTWLESHFPFHSLEVQETLDYVPNPTFDFRATIKTTYKNLA